MELLTALTAKRSTQSPSAETKPDYHEIFSKVSSGQQQMKVPGGVAFSPAQILKADLYDAISRSTYLYDISDTANFFDCGLDSLQITSLVDETNTLLLTIRPGVTPISAQDIYSNPSVESLLAILYNRSSISADSDLSTLQQL